MSVKHYFKKTTWSACARVRFCRTGAVFRYNGRLLVRQHSVGDAARAEPGPWEHNSNVRQETTAHCVSVTPRS